MADEALENAISMIEKMPNGTALLTGSILSFNCSDIVCGSCPIYTECDTYDGYIGLNEQEVNTITKNYPELFI